MEREAPGLGEIATSWSIDLPWGLFLLGLAAGYAWLFLRSRAHGPVKAHSWLRFASFEAGVALTALAVLSPLEHYGNQLLWVNFAGFLVLTMIAAPLLVLGSPLTLAFRVAGPGGRKALRACYRSWPVRTVTFPVTAWLLFAVVTYVWQFTGLTDAAATNADVRDLQLVTLLFAGLCFWTPALCADPLRWRMAYPLRALYVGVEMTHKGLFGGMFLSMNTPFHHGFARDLPSWAGITPMHDQRMGILVLWIGGNLVFLVALIAIVLGWMAYERRHAHRTDWRLALQREAQARRAAALEQVFRRSP